jgi:hypothetical protein
MPMTPRSILRSALADQKGPFQAQKANNAHHATKHVDMQTKATWTWRAQV